MDYIIGIDQGGSKTAAIISDLDGNVLGYGTAEGGNHTVIGMEAAMRTVKQAVDFACSMAFVSINQCIKIVAGMTGADFEYEYLILKEGLAKVLSVEIERVKVVNDCIIALQAGTIHQCGVIICAGSGLNCGIQTPDGEEFIFGYYIDEPYQGGGAIGKRALTCVFDAYAGLGDETMLTERLLQRFHHHSVDDLLHSFVFHQIKTEDLKHLIFTVIECGELGDKVSLQILSDFGLHASRYVIASLRRYHLLDSTMDIVLSGSIFKCRLPILKDTLTQSILQSAPNVVIKDAEFEPVAGAVILGLQEVLGHIKFESVRNTLVNSFKEFSLVRI